MKHKLLSLFVGSLILTSVAFAQDRKVSGRVTGADGKPLAGVTIAVQGSNVATQTDANGNYSLSVPNGKILVFRSVGYGDKTLIVKEGQNSFNVSLSGTDNALEEVVVTAVGISRKSKSLGYSTTNINNEEITRTSPVSMFDGLQGKIAGATITSQSGAPGASTKVILRGYSSIGGNNQPLYVIDGVPVNNTSLGSAGSTRSADFGNQANDINPDDIESINILKGAGATSLYGSRAANGVIVITTKKGKAGKIKVDLGTSATYSSILMLPKLQNTFGQGWSGVFSYIENGSWGPRFDGIDRLWGNVVNNQQQVKPWVGLKNNIRDFYTTGSEYNTNVSVSGGNEISTFYLSYGNISSDGIVPTNADSYGRNSVSLRGSTVYNKFKASASLNYVNRHQKFIATGQGSNTGATMFQELIQIPRDMSIIDFKDYKYIFNNVDNYFTPYAQNPYFVLNENGNNYNSDRFYGNTELNYEFTDWLSATARVGADLTNVRIKDWQAISRPDPTSPNSSRQADVGGVTEDSNYLGEINGDFLLNFKKNILEDLTFDGLLGFNFNQRETRLHNSSVAGLTIPNFYYLSNSSNAPVTTVNITKRRLMGGYAQANFGYRNYLFLTLNARKDWSSTLPIGKNTFFYPAANLSFVLSDLTDLKPYGVSFAKFRASIGRTGNDANVYLLQSVLTPGNVGLGFGNVIFPIGGVTAFELGNTIGNNNLEPELTTEYEFGTELKFLNNRLGVDFTFYNKETDGQILSIPIAATSGYTFQVANFGLVRNRGYELTLTGTPVKTDKFSWDMTYTFAKNRNKVLELPDGLEQVSIFSGYDVDFVAIKGRPLGVFKGPTEKTDPNGNIIVNPENGLPLQADEKVEYGTSQRDYTMGLVNTFKYKDWALGFSFDFRKGGKFWSYTSQLNYFVGNAQRTTYNDRNTYIIPGSVVEVKDGDNVIGYEENTTPISHEDIANYWSNGQNTQSVSRNSVLDKTSLRLRDVTLSYNLPRTIASKIKAERVSIGVYGRNLFLWVPKSNTVIDPDASTYNNDLRGELGEFGAGPTTRSYGASLKVSF